ncbi:MAG: threonine ammonia-lyase [Myxococcota bacterium]
MVSFAEIEEARVRTGEAVKVTPLRPSEGLSRLVGAAVSLKLENHQHTGSFKSRGALNRLLTLDPELRRNGVVAASAGNHAQGVAYHATRLQIRSTIVMPLGTPLAKVKRTQDYGAEVVLHGATYEEALARAQQITEERQAVYLHGFDDDYIIAGQGTLGLELVEQNPYASVVVLPVGGGGLIAGVALALKTVNPSVRIVGVEVSGAPSMQRAIENGGPVTIIPERTLAEGIAVGRVGQRCYEICRDHVDAWVNVEEDEVARAILYLLEQEKTVAEGAGAAAVAALLAGKVEVAPKSKVIAVVSGGNIDVNMISRIIERGLVESGRLYRCRVTVPDRPGSLATMLRVIADLQANVLEVQHERAFLRGSLGRVTIETVVETKGHEHCRELVTALEGKGFVVTTPDL